MYKNLKKRNAVRSPTSVSGLPDLLDYTDPNNAFERIRASENPAPFELPPVLPEVNRHYPKMKPSMSMPNRFNGVPLQYKTYGLDMPDGRLGSAVQNAPFVPVKKLKASGEDAVSNYLAQLDISDL